MYIIHSTFISHIIADVWDISSHIGRRFVPQIASAIAQKEHVVWSFQIRYMIYIETGFPSIMTTLILLEYISPIRNTLLFESIMLFVLCLRDEL